VDAGGNVIVTGDSYRDFVTRDVATIAYSNAGVPLWTNRYNGPANGDDVPLTEQSLALGPSESVYVAAASDGNYSNETSFDFATVKYVVSGPSLFITRSNASVILSWPTNALNFQLQENTNLAQLSSWWPVAQPTVTNGAQISVTVSTDTGRKFFRLKSR
jgi:hypothetical protein